MLDVHPPHHAANTWRDFLIHIATIVVGLLIAVGLEQAVEALHHRHQRTELIEQMRSEAEHNLSILDGDLRTVAAQAEYNRAIKTALLAGSVSGESIDVQGVLPPDVLPIINSPSQGTWHAAQAGGVALVLPPELAKLYDRVDFSLGEVNRAEDLMYSSVGALASECVRTGYRHDVAEPSRITLAQRNDLLFQVDKALFAIDGLLARLALFKGDSESVVHRVTSLQQVYAYQDEALRQVHFEDSYNSFYGKHAGDFRAQPAK